MEEITTRTYQDFVLFADDPEQDEHGRLTSFTVRVFQSPMGEGEQEVKVPAGDLAELETLSRALAKRTLGSNEQMQLGSRLAELLLPPSPHVRGLYEKSLGQLRQGEGLRLRLRLLDQLANLPWEFMYIQEARGELTPDSFLALDPRISIVRHEALPIAPEWFPPEDRLRVLITMASPEPYDEYRELKSLPQEQRAIRQELARVHGVEVYCLPDYGDRVDREAIPGASAPQLTDTLTRLPKADIFHFSGHGDFAERVGREFDTTEGQGCIVLADEHNQAMRLPGYQLAELLRGHGIRLVTLGACQTAQRDRLNVWSSVAAALMKARIPSVVAMQFTIRDDLAAAFMAALYDALVGGRTIDEAVLQGRLTIRARTAGEGADVRDWCAPVLYCRVPSGQVLIPVTDQEVRREAQRRAEQRLGLHQGWWDWTTKGVTPSRSQLQHLAAAREEVDLTPVQALILLRSAVEKEAPAAPWLDCLRQEEGKLIRQLDDPALPAPVQPAEAGPVLGLEEAAQQGRPPGVGAVAWAAAVHGTATTRHTAALALTALGAQEGIDRWERALHSGQALKALGGPGRRWWRRMELRGALADADPGLAAQNAALPPWDRLGVWLWRFRRRATRDMDRIVALTLGAGIGAGVVVGLWRFLIALPAGSLATAYLAIGFFYGFCLGAAAGLGIALAQPFLAVGRGAGAEAPSSGWGSLWQSLRAPGLALLLGTLLFGVSHLAVLWFNGLPLAEKALLIASGFLVGLGLNVGLWSLPQPGRPQGVLRWLLRLVAAGGMGLVAQLTLFAAGHPGWTATAVAVGGEDIGSAFNRWPELRQLIDRYPNGVTLLEAAVLAVALTVGVAWGMQKAQRYVQQRRELLERAQD